MAPSTAVIVGGGITGLACAYHLRAGDVTVLERSDRVGGKVHTVDVLGLPVDTGPDSFLSRSADLRELVAELGLSGEVVEPQARGSFIWSRGRLRPIPAGAVFGLPDRVGPLVRSRLLSPAGLARAGLDLVLPATALGDDPSVADLVRPRFGREVYQRMVEPLLGGVHAGDPELLSAKSTVPEIHAMLGGQRSAYLALRRRRAGSPQAGGPPPAPLVSLRGGLHRLPDALAAHAGSVHTASPALAVEPAQGGWCVHTPAGSFTGRHLVLATPAHVSAGLLRPLAPELAGHLEAIPYVGVANVTLAFRPAQVPALPEGTGFLVPPVEGEFIVGCSWLTAKWAHLHSDETVLIKCMVGRAGDDRWQEMADGAIVAAARDGLHRMVGIDAEPLTEYVQRWPQAMPQYVVGHAARLEAIDRAVAGLPGLHLTGAAYRGAGLAGCVAQAARTAAEIQGEHG